MAVNEAIQVTVIYAAEDQQHIIDVKIASPATIESVIQLSGIQARCPEIDLNKQKVGIFGEIRQLTDKVCAGDQVEIYRPLIVDPKVARRLR
ncbi:MAG: hypothetical protein A3F12_05220 [Gammaproteobacteria bacterium RIFCSPHIGHO2_12_FULL_38_14]|nr:MAG: hypothetical protein A3F12_05220 [Gammaproteobacteria bacterium RIFCSPHIGHO2_12_FULL_38_14]